MVHETKFLIFWRALNDELAQRGGQLVTLDVAASLFEAQFTIDEAADVLAEAGAALRGWQADFNTMFGGN